jgi:RimJ/RimL family protein N-acetyltransferase
MNDNAPKVLSTARLYAMRLSSLDFPDLWKVLDDPVTARTLTADGKPLDEARQQAFLERMTAHWANHGFGLWAVHRVKDGAVIGYAGLCHADLGGVQGVELLLALRSDYMGKGYGSEIAARLTQVATKELHLPEVIACTTEQNPASRRVLEKQGFRFDRHIEHAGLPHYLYRLAA